MVLQTKLVDTVDLEDLSKQLIELRKDELPKKVSEGLKDVVKKLTCDEGRYKLGFQSLFVALLTHLIENKDYELDVLEVCSFFDSLD